MPDRIVTIVRRGFDDRSGYDTGVSHALLDHVSDGTAGETFRVSVPGPVLAFGKRDVHSDGFLRAVEIARRHGYAPVIRLPGGRAAVFHEQTISFSWTIPDDDPITSIRRHFAETATLVTRALDRLGVAASVGDVPGEYCPGEFSVHHAGRIKLAGIGQRIARNACHVGGVLVVGEPGRVRDVLVPVYRALDLPMDPDTVGAVTDVTPLAGVGDAVEALIDALSEVVTTTPGDLDDSTLERASELASLHVP